MRKLLAFPQKDTTPDYVRDTTIIPGLTIRDYFAAKSLAGQRSKFTRDGSSDIVAEIAVQDADALMKALGYT